MDRVVRTLTANEWADLCADWATAAPPNPDDNGVVDVRTGEELTDDEWQRRAEAARRERHADV